jgi:hypothetical protein
MAHLAAAISKQRPLCGQTHALRNHPAYETHMQTLPAGQEALQHHNLPRGRLAPQADTFLSCCPHARQLDSALARPHPWRAAAAILRIYMDLARQSHGAEFGDGQPRKMHRPIPLTGLQPWGAAFSDAIAEIAECGLGASIEIWGVVHPFMWLQIRVANL